MGKLSRTKGHNFEREVAALINAFNPGARAKRVLIETREGNSGDVENALGWCVQCKVGAQPPIYDAVREAQEAAREDDIPMAFIRRNAAPSRGKAEFVVIPIDAFFRLLNDTRYRGPSE